MLKKILLFTFLACMSIASSCFAITLMKMGPVITENQASAIKSSTKDYYYDANDIKVDRNSKTVEYSELFIESKSDYNNQNGKMIFHRRLIDFSKFDLNTDRKIIISSIVDGDYYSKAGALKITHTYKKQPNISYYDIFESNGKNYYPNVIYREFSGLLNLPNLDGSPYLTPKSLGLNWIKSTSQFGVFYDPKSIKVKGDSVAVKIYVWIPSINRIELLNGKLNYTDETFTPSSIKFFRINTGDVTESYKQGLIPGIVGDKLHVFNFYEEEPIKIAAIFFKTKLVQ